MIQKIPKATLLPSVVDLASKFGGVRKIDLVKPSLVESRAVWGRKLYSEPGGQGEVELNVQVVDTDVRDVLGGTNNLERAYALIDGKEPVYVPLAYTKSESQTRYINGYYGDASIVTVDEHALSLSDAQAQTEFGMSAREVFEAVTSLAIVIETPATATQIDRPPDAQELV